MTFTEDRMAGFSAHMARALVNPTGPRPALALIAAAVLPFQAAYCVVNRRDAAPAQVCDSFTDPAAKRAVPRHVRGTYVLNPVYNAYLAGLSPGLHRMRDLAPDLWGNGDAASGFEVARAHQEETNSRTHGWPPGLQELVLAMHRPDGMLGEISFAPPSALGGFPDAAIARLRPFVPLVTAAFCNCCKHLAQQWRRQAGCPGVSRNSAATACRRARQRWFKWC